MEHLQDDPGLDERDLAPTWLAQFRAWHEDVRRAGVPEPDAMLLATADGDGRPSARTVLLKGLDDDGFVFFTNFGSRKGLDLSANPHACLVFQWISLHRQVVVTGGVEDVGGERADAYFATRPYGSRIGAAASDQSHVIASRAPLEAAQAALEARYPEPGPVPRPSHWGGFRVVPETVEFWQGRANRLHDRLRFRVGSDGKCVVERLSP